MVNEEWNNTNRMLLNFFLSLVGLYQICGVESSCDRTVATDIHGGNIGQSSTFNWLGVLRVYIDKSTDDRIAVTTIILIRDRFAMGSASDIGRIPKSMLLEDTLAVFLIDDEQTWDCEVLTSHLHPEYKRNNYTLAIIELNIVTKTIPITPVCIAMRLKNTYQNLYAAGTTHENSVLEKIFYKMSYVSKLDCRTFYTKKEVKQKWVTSTPVSNFTCAYSANSGDCDWENGMVLIANVSGWFNLIGFGLKGPGCSSPARFLDVKYYLPWLRFIITTQRTTSPPPMRSEDYEYVPAHHLFTASPKQREDIPSSSRLRLSYTGVGDVQRLPHYTIRTSKAKENSSEFIIYRFNDTWSRYRYACTNRTHMVYHELTGTYHFLQRAVLTYDLSMYSQTYQWVTCVRLGVQTQYKSETAITFSEIFNYIDDIRVGTDDDTFIPREFFEAHHASQYNRPLPESEWPLESNISNILNTPTYELYIQLDYLGYATLEFEMFGRNWSKAEFEYHVKHFNG